MKLTFFKFNLKTFKNSFVARLKLPQGVKECIVIPIEDNDICIGKKGWYQNMCIHSAKLDYADHVIKPSIRKERYETMTKQERITIPTFAYIKENSAEQNQTFQPMQQTYQYPKDLSF